MATGKENSGKRALVIVILLRRVYRIYYELELNLRIKPKKRIVREKPDRLSEDRVIRVLEQIIE